MRDDKEPDDLYDEVERRALFDLPEEEAEEPPDLLSQLRAREGDAGEVETAKDLTLGGYIELHNRVPAFEGIDGQPYTVDIDADETGEADQPWSAFFVFIRWAETGAGIMDHCLSGDLARGASADEARAALLDRTLYEVKAELDAAIERKRLELAE
jgi:hypothetical protein